MAVWTQQQLESNTVIYQNISPGMLPWVGLGEEHHLPSWTVTLGVASGLFCLLCGLPVVGTQRYLLNELKTTSALKTTICQTRGLSSFTLTAPGLWCLQNVRISLSTVLSGFQGQNTPISALPGRPCVCPKKCSIPAKGPFPASCTL